MATTHEYGAVLFGGYLWVITGNGLRYGIPSLLSAYIISVIGFSIVVASNDFWQEHIHITIGLIITLLLVPLYTLKLLGQLNNAIQAANDAVKVKSQFLAHMSHEMRTPLNGLVGVGELLLHTPLNNEQMDLVKSLKRSAKELRRMIDSVLDLIKLENGKMQSEQIDFDLHDLLNNASEIFLPQAELKGLTFNIRITPETPFALHGDAMHLFQVLINLTGNALKFTDKGKIDITISTLLQDAKTARIRFAISDTGIGIPQQAQSTVFDKFTQADVSVSRKYGGTGLGTTIARDLVKLMDGQIGFTSTPGHGSVFWFELPFAKQKEVPKPALTSINQLLVITMGLNQDDCNALTGHLTGWGVRVEHKAAFSQFFVRLHELKTHQQDGVVVVCSPHNFGMNPNEFAQQLLRHSAVPSSSLIMLTAEFSPEHDAEYNKMGYSTILRSPINKKLLFNTLHRIISPQQPSDAAIPLNDYFSNSRNTKHGKKILLAEDNHTSSMIVAKMLEHGGHTVTIVTDGNLALDALERQNFDLMILDMNMPTTGGLEVVRIHRAISGSRSIPAIILTADATNEAMRECQEICIDAFLTKPVNTMSLLDTIARLIESTEKDAPSILMRDSSAADGNDSPLINEVKLHQLTVLGGDNDRFMTIVIHGFIDETERLLASMHSALREQNYTLFREIGHTIKGSSGNVGADALQLLLCNIMRSNTANIHDSTPIDDMFAQLQSCFLATKKAMLNYMNTAATKLS